MPHTLRHDPDVPSDVVEGPCHVGTGEDGDARRAPDEEGPFVSVGVPVHFADAAGLDDDVCGGDGGGEGEVGRVGDADFAAGGDDGFLGKHFVGELVAGCLHSWFGRHFGIHGAREGAGEDVLFFCGNMGEDFRGEAEVFAEDRLRDVCFSFC